MPPYPAQRETCVTVLAVSTLLFLNIQRRIRRRSDLVNAGREPFTIVLADQRDVVVLAAAVLLAWGNARAEGSGRAFWVWHRAAPLTPEESAAVLEHYIFGNSTLTDVDDAEGGVAT